MDNSELPRRAFVKRSATALSGLGVAGLGLPTLADAELSANNEVEPQQQPAAATLRKYDGVYEGARLNRVAFPMGGLGAGMICLEGTGALSHVSIRNQPDVFNAPCIFAAVAIRGSEPASRVLEGPVPGWKIFGARNAANGDEGASYGLPRFERASFKTRFPFGTITLRDARLPISAQVVGWSPFTPGDADSSSLPVAALEYRLHNESAHPVAGVFSFNAKNFLPLDDKDRRAVRAAERGFTLWSAGSSTEAWKEASFTAEVDDPNALVNLAWFRGGWWDPLTMAWKDVSRGEAYARPAVSEGEASPGATIFVPFSLAAGATKTIVVRLSWYAPQTNLRTGTDPGVKTPDEATRSTLETHVPWYAGRHDSPAAVATEWRTRYAELRQRSEQFAKSFYDSTLPPEVIDAVAANLTILKSPTILRQRDGRLWAWEGCSDERGCCSGTCTHVWNYAQAIPNLFPSLERTLRETEFGPSQDERGHQAFRTALPIRPQLHDFHAASDGQLGGIMKVHRDWRVSGDTEWMRALWPKVRASLDYCMETWDPEHKGWLEEPHHNTYDIEFWGPEPMCTSFYLGALAAAVAMGKSLGDDVTRYADVLTKGRSRVERELFNGEYFVQQVEFEQLRAAKAEDKENLFGLKNYSPEARALLEKEGPKYQYGTGCLSDGVLGAWMAMVCGVGEVLDRSKVTSHLRAIHRYNLKHDLSTYPNPQRPSYANGNEGGVLLCTWPRGGALSLPFVYSDEVWTGIEYQVASHLMMMGLVREGLDVVRTCRDRYDGRVRNPFDEYECGHWYARAMSSYALLQGLSGARYDAVDKVLHLEPRVAGDFRAFFSTATGFGTVGVRGGKPFFDVASGKVEVREITYRASGARA